MPAYRAAITAHVLPTHRPSINAGAQLVRWAAQAVLPVRRVAGHGPQGLLVKAVFGQAPGLFKQLKLPQPPDAMRGQPFARAPATNGAALGNTRMLGNVCGSKPWFKAQVDGRCLDG